MIHLDLPGPGDQIATYRIERPLGYGGMAVVYLAEDIVLDRHVALKVIQPMMGQDQRFKDRFVRESRMAAQLEHPNIVPVYSAGTHEGICYIAMRYIRGGDLETLLESPSYDGKPLETDLALALLDPVADALDTAHERGLVHRDVKPANILLDQQTDGSYRVFLSDFGIAKAVEGTRHTTDGDLLGSPPYISPEQARGEAVDSRTDVYALACVVFRCLTGSPPFVRDNPLAVIAAHSTEPAPLISDLRPALSALDPVMARALSKAREERQRTCSALMADVRRAVDEQVTEDRGNETIVVSDRPTGPGDRTDDRRADDRAGERAGPRRRRILGLYAVGLVLVVGLGLLAGSALRSDDEPAAPPATTPSDGDGPVAATSPAPTGVQAERVSGGIDVTWTDNTDGRVQHFLVADGELIYEEGTAVSAPAGETSVFVSDEALRSSGFEGETCLAVRAGPFVDEDEERESDPVCV